MDISIIALVSLLAVAAHLLIFGWVRFKITEGVILNPLSEIGQDVSASTQGIAEAAGLKAERVQKVCARSKLIQACEKEPGHWLRIEP